MNRSEIREFFFREGHIHFDAMVNPAFRLRKDLTKKRYREFAEVAGFSPKLDMTDALTNLRLLTPTGMTNAGALVLGEQGSKYLISATAMCALFQGFTKAKILDQKLFDGDVRSNYQNAQIYLQSHLNTEYIITSVRTNKLELPEDALREALINAIAHRDYRSPADIQVCIFQDRVEIVNPGGLVGGMRLAELGRRSMPRNPLLFGTLYRMEKVEHIGSGIRRMNEAMQEYGLPPIEVEADGTWFSATFRRKAQGASADRAGLPEGTSLITSPITNLITDPIPLSKKQAELVLLVKKNPTTRREDLAETLGLTLPGVKWHLHRLRAKNVLVRRGSERTGFWREALHWASPDTEAPGQSTIPRPSSPHRSR